MRNKISFFLFLVVIQIGYSFPQYYCTGANSGYFPHLLNLIGSIHDTNFEELREIAVFDLGLTSKQLKELESIRKISIYKLQKTHPDMLNFFKLPNGMKVFGWYAWKPVAIKQALRKFPYVLWIDAGSTVQRPLDSLFEYIQKNSYFLGTIGDEIDCDGRFLHSVGWGTTSYVRELFGLSEKSPTLDRETVMGNVIGVSKKGQSFFLDDLVEYSKDLRNYRDDGTTPNGWGTARHDQSLLSLLAYSRKLVVHKQDYTQKTPIEFGKASPFYMTWNKKFVDEKTAIYSSRHDLSRSSYYLSKIRKK